MSSGLLFDCDKIVADWAFSTCVSSPFVYDRALGVVSDKGTLLGAIFFTGWNGHNVEISYYGKHLLTVGIVRCLARYILHIFDVSRLTVVTSKRNRQFIKSLMRFGFKVEGIQRCYYGKKDCIRNTGIRFVLFRDRIEQISALPSYKKAA